MATSPFDLSDEASVSSTEKISPLWTLKDLDDDAAVLKWTNDCYDFELERSTKFREQALRHVALFKGRFYPDNSYRDQPPGPGATAKVSKLVVNHLFQLVQQRLSRALRTKAQVDIAPANSEYSDRVSAKVVKAWVDYLLYQNNFDKLVGDHCLAAWMMGESYILVRWNPDLGEPHPDWKKESKQAAAEQRPARLPVEDDDGNPVIGEDGQQLYIEKPLKTGDVEFVVATPINTLVELCGDFAKATYCFYESYENVDELRAKYKNVATSIKEDSSEDVLAKWRKALGATHGPMPGKVLVRHFYQAPSDYLATGRFILSTRSAILVNKPLPPQQTGLPLVRLTDIDVPNEQRGMSFFTQGKALNATINDLTSMSVRNAKMLTHPKWMLPKGSLVKTDALGNDTTIVEYKGDKKPEIQVPPPMNSDNMALRSDLKADLQTTLGTSEVASGNVPPNVRSAAALNALYEAEDMRASASNVKQAAVVREVIEKAINLASCYYEKDDERLIPVVGRDKRALVKDFDPVHLTKSYDIRVSNETGMPSSRFVRADMITKLQESFPGMYTNQQVAELMQYGDQDEYLDNATVALRSAEAENESMLSMEQVEEPTVFEDCIGHWMTHMRECQNRGFKTATPPEVQASFIAHIMATEMLMMKLATRNPRYAQELTKIPQFPVFYEISMQDRMVLDYARTGNPLTLQQTEVLYQSGQLIAGMNPGGGANPATSNTLTQAPVAGASGSATPPDPAAAGAPPAAAPPPAPGQPPA